LVKANQRIFNFISLTILIARGIGIIALIGRRIRTSRTKIKYLHVSMNWKTNKLQSECRICRYLEPEMSSILELLSRKLEMWLGGKEKSAGKLE